MDSLNHISSMDGWITGNTMNIHCGAWSIYLEPHVDKLLIKRHIFIPLDSKYRNRPFKRPVR